MSFKFLISAVRAYGGLVTALVIVGCLTGLIYSAAMPKTYEATAKLVVEMVPASAGGGSSELSTNDQYVQQKLPTYVEFARSSQVLDGARSQLKIADSTNYLAEHLQFSVPADTVVLRVTATWGSANEAARVANAVADSFAKRVTELDAAGSGQSDVAVNIFEPAAAPSDPQGSVALNLLVGTLAGAILGVVLALILKLRDPWSRTLQEISMASDSDVLAVVGEDTEKQPRPMLQIRRAARRSATAQTYAGLFARLGLANSISRPRVLAAVASEKGTEAGAVAWGLAQVAAASGIRAMIAAGDPRLQSYIAARCWASAAGGDTVVPELFPSDGLHFPKDGVISTTSLNFALNEHAGSSDMVVIAVQTTDADPSSRSWLDVADQVVLVAPPRPRTARLKAALDLIRESGADLRGVVLTARHSSAKALQLNSAIKPALEGATQ